MYGKMFQTTPRSSTSSLYIFFWVKMAPRQQPTNQIQVTWRPVYWNGFQQQETKDIYHTPPGDNGIPMTTMAGLVKSRHPSELVNTFRFHAINIYLIQCG